MSKANEEKTGVVNGFAFVDAAEAEQAKKEIEGVEYIREKIDKEDPEAVLQIYNKMVQQKLFETAVGYCYLKDMQEYLRTIPFIDNGDILPIQVQHPVLEEHIRKRARGGTKEKTKSKGQKQVSHADYKKRYDVLLVISIILTICVVMMFGITATTNNATILNYETLIIDKYEAWEQELEEREAAVKEREQEIGEQGD